MAFPLLPVLGIGALVAYFATAGKTAAGPGGVLITGRVNAGKLHVPVDYRVLDGDKYFVGEWRQVGRKPWVRVAGKHETKEAAVDAALTAIEKKFGSYIHADDSTKPAPTPGGVPPVAKTPLPKGSTTTVTKGGTYRLALPYNPGTNLVVRPVKGHGDDQVTTPGQVDYVGLDSEDEKLAMVRVAEDAPNGTYQVYAFDGFPGGIYIADYTLVVA